MPEVVEPLPPPPPVETPQPATAVPRYAFEVFPDGGGIVYGRPNRLFLQARGSHGPVEVSGVVVDSVGKELTPFHTEPETGRGKIDLIPEEGRRYYFRVTRPVFSEIPFPPLRAVRRRR